MKLRALLAAAAAFLIVAAVPSALVLAQSSPALTTGQVPTASLWRQYFGGKVDTAAGSAANLTLTGAPTAPTPAASDASGRVATTAFVASKISRPAPARLRPPGITDNLARGYKIGDLWLDPDGLFWQAVSVDPIGLWIQVANMPARPLDGISPAPAVAYGTILLRTGYAGYALRLRATGGATLDVGFLPSGEIDESPADAFCLGLVCEIVTVYDQMPGACNATAVTGSAPIWDRSKRLNGRRIISHQSNTHPFTVTPPYIPAVDQYLTIPSCLSWTPQSSTWLMAGYQANSKSRTDNHSILSSGDGTSFQWSQTSSTASGRGMSVAGTSGAFQLNTAIPTSPSVFAVAGNNGIFQVYINGNYESINSPKPGTYSGALIGQGAGSAGAIMGLGAFALWTGNATTTTVEPPAIAAFERAFRIQRQFDDIVVTFGDSETAGVGSSTGGNWPLYAVPLISKSATVYNLGSSGLSMGPLLANFTNLLTQLYTSARGATARNFVIVLAVGINDLHSGRTSDELIADYQTFVAAAKALGSNVKVIATTVMMQCTVAGNAQEKAYLQAVNAWLVSKYATAIGTGGAAGGFGGDGLFDQFANPLLSDPTYATSVMCSNTVTPDGLHLRDPYQASNSPIAAAAINAILAQ